MQPLNRNVSPNYSLFDTLDLKMPSTISLLNGAPLYYLNTPNAGVLKIDFIYNAGLANQKLPGLSSATIAMLSEGTSDFSAKQLADNLDQYGSYLQAKTNVDDAQITLYCLPKYLHLCIPYVKAVLTDCSFPLKELETYKTTSTQRFLINSQRNGFLGRRAFYASIFGKENPYGGSVNIKDYENISRETVTSFYKKNILSGFKYIMVSGEVSDTVLKEIDASFGGLTHNSEKQKPSVLVPQKPQFLFVENPFSVQSSIRIGCSFVNRNHADFNKLQLLNLALGGFFGSRLMKNIREEKGLTYGISSTIESYINGGAFYIETEINNDLLETGRTEILKEVALLCESQISEAELLLVKNYMIGSFIRWLDGPFSLMDRHKMIIDYGFTHEYYQNFVNTIKATTAIELKELACKYLHLDSLTTIITGKKQDV